MSRIQQIDVSAGSGRLDRAPSSERESEMEYPVIDERTYVLGYATTSLGAARVLKRYGRCSDGVALRWAPEPGGWQQADSPVWTTDDNYPSCDA